MPFDLFGGCSFLRIFWGCLFDCVGALGLRSASEPESLQVKLTKKAGVPPSHPPPWPSRRLGASEPRSLGASEPGRAEVATRRLRRGELVLRERPLLGVPGSFEAVDLLNRTSLGALGELAMGGWGGVGVGMGGREGEECWQLQVG